MELNKNIMAMILIFLVTASQQTANGQANRVQGKIDLTGEWVGETSSVETSGIRRVRIEHNGTEVLMTNLTDSKTYKKGEWLMKGSFSENPFRVIVNTFAIDDPNIKTTYEGYAEVVSNDLIKISLPPRKGRRRLVRGTTVFIQRVTCTRYYLSFAARGASPGHAVGHAFVRWIKLDGEGKHTEAWGMYPQEDASGIAIVNGKVPGQLADESSKEGTSHDVYLLIEVSREDYERTLNEKDHWARGVAGGKFDYDLVGQNCVTFLKSIASLVGHQSQSPTGSAGSRSEPLKLPSWESGRLPYSYVSSLAELNSKYKTTQLKSPCEGDTKR